MTFVNRHALFVVVVSFKFIAAFSVCVFRWICAPLLRRDDYGSRRKAGKLAREVVAVEVSNCRQYCRLFTTASISTSSVVHGCVWRSVETLTSCRFVLSVRVCVSSESSQMFTHAATKLRRDMWWQMVKTRLMIAGGVLVGRFASLSAYANYMTSKY